ncbi:PfkB family carbohydrate kinase [Kitasatospora purpeofusca]|uniref:PfkB family carbohydrate kinase n=1 Tax=Kitasatospora purpeofusca TaxID=67352 RepID=UPI002259DD69|nr:PfkB family carbohydrate kinase [Kitasatospora purpeofusca]MCX4756501.1 PfkB family carbohydrate kinase [Kitasatospora purpeofusca]WSR35690.1 PfkB family carbohydrate kinase [Kitasatospora purpeofusca]WSR43997.1 PfkB family carbohydrate kinase [Kitasatospora purpeofusca]
MTAPSTPGRVVAIGSVNIDRILRCPVLPAPGETVLAAGSAQGFGGKGANQAVAAAAMGAPTCLVARVGADAEGRAALADLRAAGVATDAVRTDPDAPTGLAVVLVDPAGENSIVVVPGANGRLTGAEVAQALAGLALTSADTVLTSGEVPEECIRATASALPAGPRWIHNAAPAGALPDWSGPGLRRPLLVANAVEAAQLTGRSADAAGTTDGTGDNSGDDRRDGTAATATALAALGDGAVVTLGAAGALVATGGALHRVPAPEVAVVDTTGAGDVFCGALAARLAQGASLPEAAATAVAAGAFAVTALGARGALPRPADLTGPAARPS